jgi:CheY-like chemotaxis protein
MQSSPTATEGDNAAEPGREQHEERAPLGEKIRVLLVEDEPLVRLTVAHYLRALGFDVMEAGNGEEALQACAQANGEIDLLATDVMMPGMGGRELASRIAAQAPRTRCLFMSAFPAEELLERGQLEPGAVLLSKPFGRRELAAGIRHVLGWEDPATTSLLVVDDSDLSRRVLTDYMESGGYRTFAARGRREAEEILRLEWSIGVVVTDVLLPDGDGRALVREQRALRPELKGIYMSSRSRDELGLEEDEFLVPKPVNFQLLGWKLEQAIGLPTSPKR